MMKAAFVFLADEATHNWAARQTLRFHQAAGLGFEANRLPYHLSLKQPFSIDGLTAAEAFFDRFAASLRAVKVSFQKLACWPSEIFGYPSGVLAFQAEKSPQLAALHTRLNKELEASFGPCPAAFDGDAYTFHMTLSIGGGGWEAYQRAYERFKGGFEGAEAVFDRLALLYYHGEPILPGSYFCYKQAKIL